MRVVQDFTGGKMNSDVDPRYMPKGQYREARNVRVIDTDGGNSGVIESLDGTGVIVDEPLWTSGSRVVGLYEHDNKVYMFTALSSGGFTILEHDTSTGKSEHVLVDQLSSLREVDGLKNTICFLHNKRDEASVFNEASRQGFGWYVPSKEEIGEALEHVTSNARYLLSEREEEILDFNEENIMVGTLASPGANDPSAKRARAAQPVAYYWTSSEHDETRAYVYSSGTGPVLAEKTASHHVILVKRFRFDVPPSVGDSVHGGSVYKVDLAKREARVVRVTGTYKVYDSTPEVLIQSLVTPFNGNVDITGFAMLGDIMIFNDWMTNEPVEIDTSKTRGYKKFYDWTSMKLVKRPPLDVKVEVVERSELSEMRNINPLFAARYVYDTRETSAISPYSGSSSALDERHDSTSTSHYLVQMYLLEDRITFVKDIVDPVSGSRTGTTEITVPVDYGDMHVPIDHNSEKDLFHVKSFKVSARDVDKDKFSFESAIAIAAVPSAAFNFSGDFIHYTEGDERVNVVQNFANKNDGADITKDGSMIYYAKTTGAPGDNNGQLILHDYNKNTGELSEIQGFIGDGDQHVGGFCFSDNGKYVYVVYKSEYAYSSEFGRGGTFNRGKLNDFVTVISKPRGVNVTCSGDGKVVYIACINDFEGDVKYTIVSKNYGKDFSVVSTTLVNNHMACSSNGSFFVMCGNTINDVYFSKDSGTTIKKVPPQYVADPGSYLVRGVTMSPDGRHCYISAMIDRTAYLFKVSEFGLDVIKTQNYEKNGVRGCSVAYARGEFTSETLNEISNATSAVNITVNTGNEHVKKVQVLMKTGAGMYKVKTIDKEKEGLADNVDHTFKFTFSGIYPLVASKDVNKLFDNVPLKARSCMIIENSVVFGGYEDGFDIDTDVKLEVNVANTPASSTSYSLKTGTTQGYGIIFMDEFGRCSPVLADTEVDVPRINTDVANIGRVATVKVTGTPPSWARYFKFARRNPRVLFDTIDGFDNAYVLNDKLYLEITSMPWIVPNAGDKLELLSELETIPTEVSSKGYVFEVRDKVQVQGEPGQLSVTLSDGTKVDMGDSERAQLPNGRYVVIDVTGKEGYTVDDVTKKESRWTTSRFYVIMHEEDNDSVSYQEVPGIHDIEAGFAGSYTLDNDGDVMLANDPAREMNKFANGGIFSTLGRANAISENYSREDRIASLCVSEAYVEDTKDNGLSSFNTGLVNYTDLDKKFGEIVKIDDHSSNIDVYQRNKVSRVMYKKNVLNTATGDSLVSKSEDLFGEQQPYAEDCGMSDHRTYARDGNNRFFVDGRTGEVLRKGLNWIFPISSYGMMNYFHDNLTRNGAVCGGYDPRHSSYVLHLNNECVNFMEAVDGWTSFYDMRPEWMRKAGGDLYTVKDAVIRKMSGDPDHQNLLEGVQEESAVHLVNNDFPEVNKVYNSVIVESNNVPDLVVFRAGNTRSSVTPAFFVKKENLLETFIPKDGSKGTPYPLLVPEEGITSSEFSVVMNVDRVSEGDVLHVSGKEVGKVLSVVDGVLTMDREVTVPAGEALYVKDTRGADGDAARGKYLDIFSYFSVREDNKLLLKSLQIDIDESKI